jgi:hypothetical protein
MLNPDFPRSHTTCPRNDQRLPLRQEIANCDFKKYETPTSANPDESDLDGPCFLPAPKGLNPTQLLQDLMVGGTSQGPSVRHGR